MQRAGSSSPSPRISSWPASAQGRPKILFASRDEDAIPELKVALSALGHVLVASDGASVVSICEHELPNILIADTALPEWSGIDLTRHLKSFHSTARLPVVLLGGDSPAMIIAAINAGARYVLPKPVDPAVLRARVQTALR